MSEPFVPHHPEKTIRIEVTAREAHLINVLRKYPFGKITIYKQDGFPIRIETNESLLINEEDGLKMAG